MTHLQVPSITEYSLHPPVHGNDPYTQSPRIPGTSSGPMHDARGEVVESEEQRPSSEARCRGPLPLAGVPPEDLVRRIDGSHLEDEQELAAAVPQQHVASALLHSLYDLFVRLAPEQPQLQRAVLGDRSGHHEPAGGEEPVEGAGEDAPVEDLMVAAVRRDGPLGVLPGGAELDVRAAGGGGEDVAAGEDEAAVR